MRPSSELFLAHTRDGGVEILVSIRYRRTRLGGRHSLPLLGLEEQDLLAHDGIVFQHAHHGCGSRTLEGVEEASHGHRNEARMHQTSLGYRRDQSKRFFFCK
jgi:hypothetical protein